MPRDDSEIGCVSSNREARFSAREGCPEYLAYEMALALMKLRSSQVANAGTSLPKPYTYLRMLGSGAYGTTYLALNEETRRYCAVKKLPKSRVKPVEFFREVGILRSLKPHCVPYILCYEGVVIDAESYYLVTEFLEAYVPLSDVVDDVKEGNKTRADEEWVRDVCARLVRGLAVIHAAGIAHRDIKPNNVLVSPSGAIKYIDFGLACTAVTCKSSGAGTLLYIAPEVFLWRTEGTLEAWQRSDMWSLGATMFELATGDSLIENFRSHQGPEAPPFEGVWRRKYMETLADKIVMGVDYSTPKNPDVAAMIANLLASEPGSRRLDQ